MRRVINLTDTETTPITQDQQVCRVLGSMHSFQMLLLTTLQEDATGMPVIDESLMTVDELYGSVREKTTS